MANNFGIKPPDTHVRYNEDEEKKKQEIQQARKQMADAYNRAGMMLSGNGKRPLDAKTQAGMVTGTLLSALLGKWLDGGNTDGTPETVSKNNTPAADFMNNETNGTAPYFPQNADDPNFYRFDASDYALDGRINPNWREDTARALLTAKAPNNTNDGTFSFAGFNAAGVNDGTTADYDLSTAFANTKQPQSLEDMLRKRLEYNPFLSGR